MDHATLAAYDIAAAAFAKDWHDQPRATDLHDLVRRCFRPGLTADIGCGSGRDAVWLAATGLPAVGYDPSESLLAQARAAYAGLKSETAVLPELDGIVDNTFDNVLCETVIMHLDRAAIAPSCAGWSPFSSRAGFSRSVGAWKRSTGATRTDGFILPSTATWFFGNWRRRPSRWTKRSSPRRRGGRFTASLPATAPIELGPPLAAPT
jgi:SAM-dependent methyltransferase